MAIRDRFHRIVGNKTASGVETPSVDDPVALQVRADDKEAAHVPEHPEGSTGPDDKPAEEAQTGVKKIEAVTISWSKKSVYIILCLYVLSLCLRR